MSEDGQGSATVESGPAGYVVNVNPACPKVVVNPPKPNTINIVIDIPALAAAIVNAQVALLKPQLEQITETLTAATTLINNFAERISTQQQEGEYHGPN